VERHRFDTLSFVFGLLFVLVALIGLTDLVELTWFDLRWIGPAVLVGLGLVLVLTAGRGRTDRVPAGAHDPTGTSHDGTGAEVDPR
jgi:hypothetical protein